MSFSRHRTFSKGATLARAGLLIVGGVVLSGCKQTVTVDPAGYFNPASGTRLETEPATVEVLGLSSQVVCMTIDGSAPTINSGVCGANSTTLPPSADVTLSQCGDNSVRLLWEDDTKKYTTTARYTVAVPACEPLSDTDSDGVVDVTDNCPLVANLDQLDTDSDQAGDACDTDDDQDGLNDQSDNCPLLANADQSNNDGDALGDVCDDDDDNDTVNDNTDNCPLLHNLSQLDLNGNGVGDVCDGDDDGDGVLDGFDNCPTVVNPSQADTDNDGLGDACDPFTDTDGDGVDNSVDNCPSITNASQVDFDGDGIGDACDTPAFYVLKLKANLQCLEADGTFDVQTTTCNIANTNQRWVMTALGGGKYLFRNVSLDRCMRGYTDLWSIPYVDVQPCNSSDTKQQWELPSSGSDPMFPVQFDNVGVNFCLYGNEASGTLGNCGLIDADNRRIGIYPDGNFSAVPFHP